jgi:hypothetical protein
MNPDQDHLRLLALFHYIVAGGLGLLACIPLLLVIAGVATLNGVAPESPGQPVPPPEAGWFFIAVGSVMLLAGWTVAAAVLLAGRRLARQTHRTYCLVIAAIECLFAPLGTLLGIFTIVVLMRPSVQRLFDEAKRSPQAV